MRVDKRKQVSFQDVDRVVSGLLQQNCYRREVYGIFDKPFVADEYFDSLDALVDQDGVHLVRSRKDYPITQDFVDSFIEGSDYRRDPAGAVARSNSTPTLGDITALQDALEQGGEGVRERYADILAKMADLMKDSTAAPADVPAPTDGSIDN